MRREESEKETCDERIGLGDGGEGGMGGYDLRESIGRGKAEGRSYRRKNITA